MRSLVLFLVAAVLMLVSAQPVAADEPTPPEAVITASATTVLTNETVIIDGRGSVANSGGTLFHVWDFGDGGTGLGDVDSHVYRSPGTYTVTLTVFENPASGGGSLSDTATTEITVLKQGPYVLLDGPTSVHAGGLAAFAATAVDTDGQDGVMTYAWDFGDGTTADTPQATHRWAHGGRYDVSLTVIDDEGAATTITHRVGVMEFTECEGPLVRRTGTWRAARGEDVDISNHTYCRSAPVRRGPQEIELRFRGPRIWFQPVRDSDLGRGTVYLDGQLLDHIRFAYPEAPHAVPSWRSYAHLGNRHHRLRIVVTRGRGGIDWFGLVGHLRRP